MSFWQNTLPLMAEKNITQTALSKALDKNKSSVNKWISRDTVPPADDAYKISKLLQVDLQLLITGNDPNADTLLQKVKTDTDLREILSKIVKVDKKYWKKIKQGIDMTIALCIDEIEDQKERIG